MTDLRVRPGVATPSAVTADGIGYLPLRATRDGSPSVIDWKLMLSMEGCGFTIKAGDEATPVAISDGAADDELAFMIVDVPTGLTIIPTMVQCVIGVWSDCTLVDFIIEADKNGVRYDGAGGTAAVAMNMNTGSPKKSGTITYAGNDILPAARTALMSLELYRESVEVNLGDTGGPIPKFLYEPDVAPVIVGPGSLIVHLGATSGNGVATAYGTVQWLEFPSHQAS